MFPNNGGKVFQDVTTSGGFGHLQKGHAIAFGDIDNDGDEDIFEEMGGAYSGTPIPAFCMRTRATTIIGSRSNWKA